jgi:hypothetical protein
MYLWFGAISSGVIALSWFSKIFCKYLCRGKWPPFETQITQTAPKCPQLTFEVIKVVIFRSKMQYWANSIQIAQTNKTNFWCIAMESAQIQDKRSCPNSRKWKDLQDCCDVFKGPRHRPGFPPEGTICVPLKKLRVHRRTLKKKKKILNSQ